MTQQIDKKSARKYWWLIMILPIGLIVGTVTSLIQHLRKDKIEQEQAKYKVATDLNITDLQTALRNARDLGERTTSSEIGRKNIRTANRFIQGAISPGGTGQQFTKTKLTNIGGQTIYLNHTDIKGSDSKQILAVAIELEGSNSKGNHTKLAILPSVIRALLEAKPNKTIRFVLAPKNQPIQQLADQIQTKLIRDNESLTNLILLKEKTNVSTTDSDHWTLTDGNPIPSAPEQAIITHTILHDTPNTANLTQNQLTATLKAANQLKTLILTLAK